MQNRIRKYKKLCRQHDDIVAAEDNLRGIIADLDRAMKETFAEKFKDIGIMLNDETTRRALEYDPAGGIHIKLIKAVFSAGNPKAVYLLGSAVYKTQNDFLPVFLKFRGE